MSEDTTGFMPASADQSHACTRLARLRIGLTATVGMLLSNAVDAGTLYFAEIFNPERSDGSIRRVESDGSDMETLVNTGGGVRGLAVDLAGGKLYWTDVEALAIRRAGLDGDNQEDLVTDDLEWPRSIVLDAGLDRFYWGDQLSATISVANLDGSDAEPIRSTEFHAGLAIDALHGKLYWSTSVSQWDGDILRSDLDGGNVETVVTGEGKPAGVAIDVEGGKLYWTDYVVDVVRRSNLDGSDIEDIYVVGSNRNPRCITLDLAEGKVYWGQDVEIQGNTGKIMRMDLDGADPETVIEGVGLITDLSLGESRARKRGDLNCDDDLNFDDIDPFVLAITSKSKYEEQYPDCDWRLADINRDGNVDFDDIDPFVELLIK